MKKTYILPANIARKTCKILRELPVHEKQLRYYDRLIKEAIEVNDGEVNEISIAIPEHGKSPEDETIVKLKEAGYKVSYYRAQLAGFDDKLVIKW